MVILYSMKHGTLHHPRFQTRRDFRKRFKQAPSISIRLRGLSILSKLRLCGSWFTRTPASSANTVAFGLWRWLP
jgi:hypothetical protein